MARESVARGDNVFGAAILRRDDLSIVATGPSAVSVFLGSPIW